jgi:hypothetical protein
MDGRQGLLFPEHIALPCPALPKKLKIWKAFFADTQLSLSQNTMPGSSGFGQNPNSQACCLDEMVSVRKTGFRVACSER